ncbi:MAG: Rhodanese- sulfurtransferase [Alyxoria varia]|nr:MAG: Rhodanese- sulfurtransferase [Alyxoria varia]
MPEKISRREAAEAHDDPMEVFEEPESGDESDGGQDEDLDINGQGDDSSLGEAAAELELADEELSSEGDDEEDINGGIPVDPSDVPLIGQKESQSQTAPSTSFSLDAESQQQQPSLHPSRPIPYTHDAGHLLVSDPNPLPDNNPSEAVLAATARDATQSLLNHLLTTCPITNSKSGAGSGVHMSLPAPAFQLPREKRVPQPKAPTKWEQFAAKKGIGMNNKRKGQESAGRAGKMVYDETSGEWVPKWGYKGKNKQEEESWLVEVDPKKERKAMEANGGTGLDPRAASRKERKERVKKNEKRRVANERRAQKTKG